MWRAVISRSRSAALVIMRTSWVYETRVINQRTLTSCNTAFLQHAAIIKKRFSSVADDSLLEKAQTGDIESIAEVGRQYLDKERGDPKTCLRDARKWLEIAAELGHTESKFRLGVLLSSKQITSDVAAVADDAAGLDRDVKAEKAMKVLEEIRAAKKANRKSRGYRYVEREERGSSSTVTRSGGVIKIDHSTDEPTPTSTPPVADSTDDPSKAQKTAPDQASKDENRKEAIIWLRQAASSNHGEAMVYLGNLLLELGSPADSFEALLWYERAARLPTPIPDALYNLGTLYFDGIEGQLPADLKKSLSYFQKAADLGDISALFWLGHCHLSGEGGFDGVVNPKAAVQYLTEAAEAGHAAAHYYLAALYRSGLQASSGGAKSAGQCDGKGGCGGKGPCHSSDHSHNHDHNHDHAHDHDHSHTHDHGGHGGHGGHGDGGGCRSKHSERGDKGSSAAGGCGGKGGCGSKAKHQDTTATDQSDATMARQQQPQHQQAQQQPERYVSCDTYEFWRGFWDRDSDKKEDSTQPESQSKSSASEPENTSSTAAKDTAPNLSLPSPTISSHSDTDIPPNKELFLKHLMKAVELEEPDALYCLADLYVQGQEGYEVDLVKGREYYEKASAKGHLEATVCLGAMHYNGIGGLKRDARRAFELYNIAADGGSKDAWRNLAAMYFAGDGVPKSEDMAKEIMRVIFGVEEKKEEKQS